jgi:hypothetical protein
LTQRKKKLYNTNTRKECSGLDRNGFNKLNKICDDCFALFKEPEIYTLCRWVGAGRGEETCGLYYKSFTIVIYDRNL